MIYDLVENITLYCQEGDRLYRALRYAVEFDLTQPDGDYQVEGTEIFAKVQSYETAPPQERRFEAHRCYYDVQVLRQGRERQDVALAEQLESLTEYDPKKDVIKLKPPRVFSSIIMTPGRFAVYYPQDIHRPNCDLEGKCRVRKICMKVKL
jgi:biofilm protein TabA